MKYSELDTGHTDLRDQLQTLYRSITDSYGNITCSLLYELVHENNYLQNNGNLKKDERQTEGLVYRIQKAHMTYEKFFKGPINPAQLQPEIDRFTRGIVGKKPKQSTTPASEPVPPHHYGCMIRTELHEQAILMHLKDIIERVDGSSKKKREYESPIPDSLVIRVNAKKETKIFINADKTLSQSLQRNFIQIIASKGRNTARHLYGGIGGMETLLVTDADIDRLYDDLNNMSQAKKFKPGMYNVILDPIATGILIHEAVGHCLEADNCYKNRSKALDYFNTNKSIGNTEITVHDIPTPDFYRDYLFAPYGSYFFDDEGEIAQETTLIKDGDIIALLTDNRSARRMDLKKTANARRESTGHSVYVRQSNTFLQEGTLSKDALFSLAGDGLLLHHPAGGIESPKDFNFQLNFLLAEEIKDGRRTGNYVKAEGDEFICLKERVDSVLHKVKAKSLFTTCSDKRPVFLTVGGCSKYNKEIVPVSCGGTYTLLDKILLI